MSDKVTLLLEGVVARDRAGQGNEALELLNTLLEYQPGHRMALFYRGAVRIRYRKEILEAIADWEAAFDGAPPGASERVETLYQNLFDSCLERMANLTSQDPHDPIYHWGFGQACNLFGRMVQAERHLARAMELDPALCRAPLALARLQLREQGDPQAALQTLQKALESNPEESLLHAELGALHHQNGSLALALRHLEAALRFGDPLPSRRLLADLYLRQGRFDQAEPHFQQLLKVAPSAESYLGLAECDKQQYRFQEALDNYRQAVQLEPCNFRALCDLGALALQFGDLDLAVDSLTRALDLEPRHAEIYAHLAKAAQQKGDREAAIYALRRLLELEPEDAYAAHSLATELRASGDYRQAGTLLKKALETRPGDVQISMDLADCLVHVDRLAQATTLLREAFQRNPTHEDLRAALGRLDPSALSEAPATRGPSAEDLLNLGRAHLQGGSPSEATDCFRQAVALEPHNREGLHQLARIYLTRGLREPAADLLVQSYAVDPSDMNVLLELLGVLGQIGNLECQEGLEQLAGLLPQDLDRVPWLDHLWKQRDRPGVDKLLVPLLGCVQKAFPPGHPIATRWLDLQTA